MRVSGFASFRRCFDMGDADRRLLVRTALLQVLFVIAARVMPFAAVNRLFRRRGSVPPAAGMSRADERVGWATAVASRYLGANCLAQALAARVLLERRGVDCRLRLGVHREEGCLEAHAWLEREGRVVVGGAVDRFASMWVGD